MGDIATVFRSRIPRKAYDCIFAQLPGSGLVLGNSHKVGAATIESARREQDNTRWPILPEQQGVAAFEQSWNREPLEMELV